MMERESRSTGVMDQLVSLLTARFHLNASVNALRKQQMLRTDDNI